MSLVPELISTLVLLTATASAHVAVQAGLPDRSFDNEIRSAVAPIVGRRQSDVEERLRAALAAWRSSGKHGELERVSREIGNDSDAILLEWGPVGGSYHFALLANALSGPTVWWDDWGELGREQLPPVAWQNLLAIVAAAPRPPRSYANPWADDAGAYFVTMRLHGAFMQFCAYAPPAVLAETDWDDEKIRQYGDSIKILEAIRDATNVGKVAHERRQREHVE